VKVADLNSNHIGKYVCIADGKFILSGVLGFVEHGTNTEEDWILSASKPLVRVVSHWTSVQVGPAYCDGLDQDTNVTVGKSL
jgi:hypothetical protein